MIDLIPARPLMAERLKLQSAQMMTGQMMTPENIELAISGGMALAAMDGEKIIGMAGIFQRWENVGLAWALLADDFPTYKLAAFRLMKRALDVSPLIRIEAHVASGHAEGERLLDHLGFAKEGVMRKYWQGRDHDLYARVR